MINGIRIAGNLCLLVITAIFLAYGPLAAQQKKKVSQKKAASKVPTKKAVPVSATPNTNNGLSPEEEAEYKQKITRLISFLEFTLNTVGSDSTSAEDKEIIINKSYLKFFKDSKVQIEDDLDVKRITPTYKNVQAYLQDVDYFFTQAKFELNVEEISTNTAEDKSIYFIVTLTRYLTSATVNGDSVTNNKKRFVEINLNQKDKDLKIASIYSTGYNETQDLSQWWKGLSPQWQAIFKSQMGNMDSINNGQLKRILSTEEMHLSGDTSLHTLEPLSRLANLKILDLSNTNINDLTAIRNLVFLEKLNFSGTQVDALTSLKYLTNLKSLNLSNTKVADLGPTHFLKHLSFINFSNTKVTDVGPLAANKTLTQLDASNNQINSVDTLGVLNNLITLNLSATGIEKVDAIAKLDNLESLNISDTKISDIHPLSRLKLLKHLFADRAPISSLQGLQSLPAIQNVYIEGSNVDARQIREFVNNKPQSLVIYRTKQLQQWWNNLSNDWKKIFKNHYQYDSLPTREQLAAISFLTNIDISKNKAVVGINELIVLSNLKKLNINQTGVKSLYPLRDKLYLEALEVAGTPVDSLGALDSLKLLKHLNLDETNLPEAEVNKFRSLHPDALIIYQSSALQSWWAGLPEEWKTILKQYIAYADAPDNTHLHLMQHMDSVSIYNNRNISDLSPLKIMTELKELTIRGCNIQSIEPITNALNLQIINLGNNPVRDASPLQRLAYLKSINIENTGVVDLKFITGIEELQQLNISGTSVKDLKPLRNLHHLIALDCSGTHVRSLKSVDQIEGLQTLKCNNSRVTQRQVDKFKKSHPSCDVTFY